MVAPISNSTSGISTLRPTQVPNAAPKSVKPATNQVSNAPVATKPTLDATLLASANSPPPNLPRGSIVDKLV